jgi:Cof subfamily protein (haloacid dehalogenase superfamily)
MPPRKKFRLAAIDIDGTLIHDSRTVSDANLRAIARMRDEGIEIVLASGRHHDSMLKFAAQLPGVRWMVSSQGAEVSDVGRREILAKTFLAPETARRAIATGRQLGFGIVVYADDGVFRLDTAAGISAYAGLDGGKITPLDETECTRKRLFKVLWCGAEESAIGIENHPALAALDVTHVRTHNYLYELLPRGVTKGTGMALLARHLGVPTAETLAFGDAENDIPLFQWAAISVAMPSRWTAARDSATMVAPDGPGDTALARGIEMALG